VPRTNTTWLPAPRNSQLADGEVHVWRADLSVADERLGDLLSEDERMRADRLRSRRDREQWTIAHGILRALLSRYPARPDALEFAVGTHGKPELLGCTLRFNISHSGAIALYAFALDIEVGVDVELIGRPRDELALAARALGSAEAERLGALDPALREREFLRSWVRHEAGLKCLGVGLGGSSADAGGLWLGDLELGPRVLGAVAAARPPSRLGLWDWPGGGLP
jgi:4'-phosphopantetheinyl transferase